MADDETTTAAPVDLEPVALDDEVVVDPVVQEVASHVDPAVVEAVHGVRDRFGAAGLRDMVNLARFEIEQAHRAAEQLRGLGD